MSNLDFFEPFKHDKLDLGDKEYEIDMRIKNVLRFLELTEDKTILPHEKLTFGLNLVLYGNDLSEYPLKVRIEAYNALVHHIQGEAPPPPVDLKGNPLPVKKQEKLTDFRQDFDYVFASFMQAYRIDLLEERDMHYHKFKALLQGLPDDTFLRRVMHIRGFDTSKLKGEDKMNMLDLQSYFKLKERG